MHEAGEDDLSWLAGILEDVRHQQAVPGHGIEHSHVATKSADVRQGVGAILDVDILRPGVVDEETVAGGGEHPWPSPDGLRRLPEFHGVGAVSFHLGSVRAICSVKRATGRTLRRAAACSIFANLALRDSSSAFLVSDLIRLR